MGVDYSFTKVIKIDEIKEKTDLNIEKVSNSEEYKDYIVSDGEGEICCFTKNDVITYFKCGSGASSVLRKLCLSLETAFLNDQQEDDLLLMQMEMENNNLEKLGIYTSGCKYFSSKEERDEYVQKVSDEIEKRRNSIKDDDGLPF